MIRGQNVSSYIFSNAMCLCSTATSSDGGTGGLSDTEVISISSILAGLLCTLIMVVITVCGWYVVNKKCKSSTDDPSKCQLLNETYHTICEEPCSFGFLYRVHTIYAR